MIEQNLKRSLGQAMHAVQVVGSAHDSVSRLYTSHWVTQVSFEEPIVMASVSPKHDTYKLMVASGSFSVSMLAGDQIAEGQYFSYPGRRFVYAYPEFVEEWDGLPIVPNAISHLRCEIFAQQTMEDHELLFARVTATKEGRLKEPPLLYSSRLGWRIAGEKAREPGVSIRDQLIARLGEASGDVGGDMGGDK
jgi:3-hydroxy-9,10-secoandrosta-1,3,5(10)-triene-9,17-dione monooxygenase reductase component